MNQSAEILDHLRLSPGASVAEIAESTGIDRAKVASILVQCANDEAPRVTRGAPRSCRVSGLVVSTWNIAG